LEALDRRLLQLLLLHLEVLEVRPLGALGLFLLLVDLARLPLRFQVLRLVLLLNLGVVINHRLEVINHHLEVVWGVALISMHLGALLPELPRRLKARGQEPS